MKLKALSVQFSIVIVPSVVGGMARLSALARPLVVISFGGCRVSKISHGTVRQKTSPSIFAKRVARL
jgi:hypothetical protein